MKYTTHGLQLAALELTPPFFVTMRADPGSDIFDQPLVDLEFVSVARVLPGRRLSGLVRVGDELIFAKLFYGKDARRYWQRELNGAQRLADAQIPSPQVVGGGATEDGDGLFVLYEGLREARPLDPNDQTHVEAAVDLVAQMHSAGLIQGDIHLSNFVESEGRYYAIDADAIARARTLRQHFANLGMLLAQRSPLCDADVTQLWQRYATNRGEYVQKMGDAPAMREIVTKQRKRRVRRYLKKTQRECTEFVHESSFRLNWLCDRQHAQRLQRFHIFPEQIFGEGTPLKLGQSATVVRVTLEDHSYVVKRYNIKNVVHRMRRWFKPRARRAWCNGHHLKFLEIPIALPVALLEHKVGWFRSVSYLVMQDSGEHDLGALLSTSDENFATYAEQTLQIMLGLKAAGLQHGDFKATNFVVERRTDRVSLIDYDAVKSGTSEVDKARFLANWQERPELFTRWQQSMERAGL